MEFLEPMFAKATEELPKGAGWVFEPKYDGYRIQAHALAEGTAPPVVDLFSRRGRKVTKQFPEVATAVQKLRSTVGQDFIVDGEIVSAADDGFAGFQALQSRLGVESPFRIRMLAEHNPAALVCFDVLRVADHRLTRHSLTNRRQILATLLSAADCPVRIGSQDEVAETMLAFAHAQGLEGVMAKRANSVYRPGERGDWWLKYKFALRQEFVVAGYTASDSSAREFAALVLGYYQGGELVYAGRVGSGFSQQELSKTSRRLQGRVRQTCPFASQAPLRSPVTWVEPDTIVEVRFQEWTDENHIRFPRFLAHREDKLPQDVTRET